MGGNALKKVKTIRKQKQEYEIIKRHILEKTRGQGKNKLWLLNTFFKIYMYFKKLKNYIFIKKM